MCVRSDCRATSRLDCWPGAITSCSTVPPPVTSPLSRSTYGNAMTWSVDWGFATAHIQRPDGTTQVITGNGDSTWGIPIPACQSWERSPPH